MTLGQQERFHYLTTGDRELDRLRAYLSEWIRWERRYTDDNGAPNSTSFARFVKPGIAWDAEATGGDSFNVDAMRKIDAGLGVLYGEVPVLYLAIRWRYLNESVGAHVVRIPLLKGLTLEQLDDLADGAEKALLKIVKARGMYL